jgi:hypothetical protein
METLYQTEWRQSAARVQNLRLRANIAVNCSREDLCRTTLAHTKHFLSGVFRYARRQGVLDTANPMHDVEIPKARPAGETQAYSLESAMRT